MIKLFCYLLFSIISNYTLFAQCNDCKTVFNNLKLTIDSNYSGFPTSEINSKEYFNLLRKIKSKSRLIPMNLDCYRLLKEYLLFFDDPHLTFTFEFNNNIDSSFFKNDKYFDSFLKKNIFLFNKKFTKSEIKFFKGLWIDDLNAKVDIELFSNKIMIGRVVKGDKKYWFDNQIKFIITKKSNKFQILYETRDHFVRNEYLDLNKKEIKIGRFFRLFREKNYFESIKDFKYEKLNLQFSYIRVPNCDANQKFLLDSVLTKNHLSIISTKNLIIDLRNNPGGSKAITNLLLPYVTTGNYISYGIRLRNTPLIQRTYLEAIDNSKDSIQKSEFLATYNRIIKDKPLYVFENETKVIELDTFYKYPERVFILINPKSVSMAEIFTIGIKNSPKVLVIGEESCGATIFTDYRPITINCKFLKLNCPTFESYLLQKHQKRNYSILPDLSLKIPNDEWLDFIIEKYDSK